MLNSWQNFYVVVGSAAGALTGLQFVVIALVAQARSARNMSDIHAFGTPNLVNFCSALVISAAMLVPWQVMFPLAACLGAAGLFGVLYWCHSLWNVRHSNYKPEMSDWIWYFALPLCLYGALTVAAVGLWAGYGPTLLAVAAISVAIIVLGVHNSWDSITYIAVHHVSAESEKQAERPGNK